MRVVVKINDAAITYPIEYWIIKKALPKNRDGL